jgi:putative tRNA adenosine deaminase-associated protein
MRGKDGWAASEMDLSGAADIDDVADRLRDLDPQAEVSLLFVESDDLYIVIVRLDDGEDLRVFGSDSAFAQESRLGALLLADVEAPVLEIEEVAALEQETDDEEDGTAAADPDTDPVGDADLLADLGVSAHRLLELCAREGMLPADITAEVSQAIGCGDEVEELREAA